MFKLKLSKAEMEFIADKKAIKIINALLLASVIPPTGSFNITEDMIRKSFIVYGKLFPSVTGKRLSPSSVRFIDKMAYLNLMKLNTIRSGTVTVTKKEKLVCKVGSGFLYIITNPAFPGMFKVGLTTNLVKRLAQYQTADPFRQFKVLHYKFVEDRYKAERELMEQFSVDIVKGEWISNEGILKAFVV